MASFGIIAAMDCELELLVKEFAAQKFITDSLYKGAYAGHTVYLSLCGVGKVNSAVSAQRMIDLCKPDVIINTGVAGGVSRTLHVLDVAVADVLTYHDFKPLDILDRYPPHLSHFVADKELSDLAAAEAEKLGLHTEMGMIVSGDQFIDDSAYKEVLRRDFDAVCTEMEGAAIAHTAALNNIPFTVIRAISDNADEEADESFDQIAKKAAVNACKIVIGVIRAYRS